MPTLARPIRGAALCALGTLCASLHARSLSRHGKHGELAQVSYLTPPISPCASPPNNSGAASRARYPEPIPRSVAAPLELPPAPLSDGDTLPAVPRVPSVQYFLPCPGVHYTLLGPLVVVSSVTNVVGRRRRGPRYSVVSIHNMFNKYQQKQQTNSSARCNTQHRKQLPTNTGWKRLPKYGSQ